MQDTKQILLTLDGNNGKIELMETCVRITEYKSYFLTLILEGKWDKSRIDRVYEVPRDEISRVERGPDEVLISFPNACRLAGLVDYVSICFEKEQRSVADKLIEVFKEVESPYDYCCPF
jgi:hypothetical protein